MSTGNQIEMLKSKFYEVMEKEGHLHPGMIYDPVFDHWNPICLEATLYTMMTGKSAFAQTDDSQSMSEKQ